MNSAVINTIFVDLKSFKNRRDKSYNSNLGKDDSRFQNFVIKIYKFQKFLSQSYQPLSL